jgi:hypothetical protein
VGDGVGALDGDGVGALDGDGDGKGVGAQSPSSNIGLSFRHSSGQQSGQAGSISVGRGRVSQSSRSTLGSEQFVGRAASPSSKKQLSGHSLRMLLHGVGAAVKLATSSSRIRS